jgi:aminoglycoside N3'-acetyltransferase
MKWLNFSTGTLFPKSSKVQRDTLRFKALGGLPVRLSFFLRNAYNFAGMIAMQRPTISIDELTRQLHDLGVEPGGVLLVHCAFSHVRPIENGPLGLITALQTAVGPNGTLVMPSLSDDTDQPFDPHRTPCLGMGIVAHTFWQLPNVRRSHSPHAFAARGPQAVRIIAAPPLTLLHGLDSPVGQVYELDGQVLLLGVGHDANMTIHLAEYLAGVRYRRQKTLAVLQHGQPTQIAFEEIDHCCQKFQLVDEWLEASQSQRRGQIGHAEARLLRSRDLVAVATEQLQHNETVFLHPPRFGGILTVFCGAPRRQLKRSIRAAQDEYTWKARHEVR